MTAAAFVWPPFRDADRPIEIDLPELIETDTEDTVPRAAEAVSRPIALSMWQRARVVAGDLESDLLGVRAISFQRWADRAGWRRDQAGARCWRCAGSVGPHETDGEGCADCRTKKLAWSRAIRLGTYERGLRAAVLELKFGRWRRTGHEVGRELGEALAEQLRAGGIRPEEAALVPVPMSWRRRMGRGVDHTAVLAEACSKRSGVPIVRALSRDHRSPQVGLSATARAQNVRGAFRPTKAGRDISRESARPRVCVVMDDVRTTGATMTSACRAVRELVGKSPEIWCCVVCVATDRRDGGPAGGAREGGRSMEGEKFNKTFGVGS